MRVKKEALPYWQVIGITLITMLAFAANSLLCRLALRQTQIDAASFTAWRLISGACVLWVLLQCRASRRTPVYSLWGTAFLFIYAAAFSYAYVSIEAGAGALLLFGTVQITLLIQALRTGARLTKTISAGFMLAGAGVVFLLWPGAQAPTGMGVVLMIISGAAWAAYSLAAKSVTDPLAATAGNFIGAMLLACVALLLNYNGLVWDIWGVFFAVLSGGVASGLGYALWYWVIPMLDKLHVAIVQLSVPLFAALLGVMVLAESITVRLSLAACAVLGGIALVLVSRHQQAR